MCKLAKALYLCQLGTDGTNPARDRRCCTATTALIQEKRFGVSQLHQWNNLWHKRCGSQQTMSGEPDMSFPAG
jgi:hypothetical protein